MTSFFPHAAYAEDQPNSHAILYFHVWRATTMTCTSLALLTAPAATLLSRKRYNYDIFFYRTLTHAGRGFVIGSVLGLAATYAHMYGREEIEWQDRAWRLQENRREVSTDKSALHGVVIMTAMYASGKQWLGKTKKWALPWGRTLAGGMGLGMSFGTLNMMVSFAMGRRNA